MASVVTFRLLPCLATNSEIKPRFRVRAQSSSVGDKKALSDSIAVNGGPLFAEGEKNAVLIDGVTRVQEQSESLIDAGNGRLKSRVERKLVKNVISNDLDVLWDDGYGTKSVKDYFEGAKQMIRPDGGSPRWFCPIECGQPLRDSPVLLFCPGNCCIVVINSKLTVNIAIRFAILEHH